MNASYLGIVTHKGLESLVPETEHAASFLQRRIRRRHRGDAVCCWAVLAEPAARQIQLQLHLGRRRDALATLNAEARFLGTMLPAQTDEELFTAA